jgi:hypothetical protein
MFIMPTIVYPTVIPLNEGITEVQQRPLSMVIQPMKQVNAIGSLV